MEITLGQQYYNVGEKPTVILYTYINRHAGTPEKRHCCCWYKFMGGNTRENPKWVRNNYNTGALLELITMQEHQQKQVVNLYEFCDIQYIWTINSSSGLKL